jgi:hypothetical protein
MQPHLLKQALGGAALRRVLQRRGRPTLGAPQGVKLGWKTGHSELLFRPAFPKVKRVALPRGTVQNGRTGGEQANALADRASCRTG